MGAMNTHLLGEYFDGITSNTPLKSDYDHHKVLAVDPRSPTSEITRTPIQVDKTPAPAAPSLIDPRSPSCGICRTPLYQEIQEETTVKQLNGSYLPLDLDQDTTDDFSDYLDLSDPTTHLHSTASGPSLLSASDDLDIEEESEGEHELQRSISDPELSTDQICLIDRRQSESGLEFNMKSFHQSFRKKAKKMVSKISPNKSKSTSSPSVYQPTKPRRSLGDITSLRSPLATKNVDVNSPLSIVQRKQASKLNVFRRHSTPDGKQGFAKKYSMMSLDDKENLPFES
ncbi:cell division cycle-associated protein 3-like [Lineus longissimus]|uniref:cell division cycle-associated protein 3-like n=1 Tax=Lineus longissimus TaxID=88925 RepID=UPI002B4E4473